MKTPLGTEVDLGPCHIVLDGIPALRERGTEVPPLHGPFGPGHIVLDGVPALRERGTAALPSFRLMCIVATVAHLSYCSALVLSV